VTPPDDEPRPVAPRARGPRRPWRVAVAGATGYLGRHLVAELARAGHDVRALVRDPAALTRGGKALAPAIAPHVADVRVVDVTDAASLAGVLHGVDAVASCVGHTGTGGAATWNAVDDTGNRNLLREAIHAKVKRFLYVSVFSGEHMRDLAIVRAHEAFAAALGEAAVSSVVIRPTAFFSDMGGVLHQARSGWMPLVGRGEKRLNPIHGEDLAAVCVAALRGEGTEIDVGGPEVFTQREIAALAFEVLGRRPRIVTVPAPLVRAVLAALRPFAPGRVDLWRFFTTSAEHDLVAPRHGRRPLREHFEELAASNCDGVGGNWDAARP
jgi:uncharacterized protein YbjT (DUF2867 family)